MDQRSRALLTACIAFLGAVVCFGLVVYPFDYSLVEGLAVAGGFVAVALLETVLDDTSF